MLSVLKRAKQIDEARSLSDRAIQDKVKQVAEWNNAVNNLRALLDRDFNNPPTKFDFEKLEAVMFYFKK